MEGKVRSGEKKADTLVKEKMRLEADLESVTKKSHDASGQLVVISQELLKKERSFNGERARERGNTIDFTPQLSIFPLK